MKFCGKERTFFKLGEVHENQDENLGPIPLFENVHLAAIFYSKTILTNVYLLCHVKSALYTRSAQESILAAPNSYCKYKAFVLSIFLLCVGKKIILMSDLKQHWCVCSSANTTCPFKYVASKISVLQGMVLAWI